MTTRAASESGAGGSIVATAMVKRADAKDNAAKDIGGDEPEVTGLSGPETRMLNAVIQAIAERKLLPGMKLAEEQLADAFKLNRARIRKVLLVLSQRRVVHLAPNRGAFVARPSVKETRDLFQARRLVESEIVRLVAKLPRPRRLAAVAILKAHLKAEHRAIAAHDRAAEVRLSGLFHIKLATAAGNGVFLHMLRDLIAQNALAIAAYASGHELDCSLREHDGIVDALAGSDSDKAVSLAMAHLDHIERTLILEDEEDGGDLVSIFAGLAVRS